jgi:hypothetical protein
MLVPPMNGRILTLTLSLVLGCAPKPEATPSPPPSSDAPDDPTSPHDVEYAYRSGGDEDADAGDAEATEQSEKPATASGPEPSEIGALAEQAATEALPDRAGILLTPPLPIGWPPETGKVAYFAYPLEPLESGVTRWRVRQAAAKVVVTLAERSVAVEKLDTKANDKPLGTVEPARPRSDDPIHVAAAALFEVVSGGREPEKVKHRLARYVDWLDAHGVVGKDVRAKNGAFVRWLAQ